MLHMIKNRKKERKSIKYGAFTSSKCRHTFHNKQITFSKSRIPSKYIAKLPNQNTLSFLIHPKMKIKIAQSYSMLISLLYKLLRTLHYLKVQSTPITRYRGPEDIGPD